MIDFILIPTEEEEGKKRGLCEREEIADYFTNANLIDLW